MPRDVIAEEIPNLTYPTVEGLKYLLRHPERWSLTHKWRFDDRLRITDIDIKTSVACGTAGCAIGIADVIWGKHVSGSFFRGTEEYAWGAVNILSDGQFKRFKALFGGQDTFHKIFEEGMNWPDVARQITPEVVIGRIEDWQEGRPIRLLRAGDHP